jgi:hypothetical protein
MSRDGCALGLASKLDVLVVACGELRKTHVLRTLAGPLAGGGTPAEGYAS